MWAPTASSFGFASCLFCGVLCYTRLLRQHGYRLPVVGVTGISSSTDRKAFVSAGVDKLLFKPITRVHIEKALESLHLR